MADSSCPHSQVHARSPSSFFFNDPAPTGIYTLSLHDALPISRARGKAGGRAGKPAAARPMPEASTKPAAAAEALTPSDRRPVRIAVARGDSLDLIARLYGVDRKSTRLNSSHVKISYAVFCLKK